MNIKNIVLALIMAGLLGTNGYQFYVIQQMRSTNDTLRLANNELQGKIEAAETENENLQNTVADVSQKLAEVQAELEDEDSRLDPIRSMLREVADDVAIQEKLASIDPELLQKYSRVYFLNENYYPSSLSPIPTEFSIKDEVFHSQALPFLLDMLEDARSDGYDLKVASAYRSFDRQSELKSYYTTIYGEGANQFSADQGYSEHQLGTTVDLTSAKNNYTLEGFDETAAFAWLQDNAHEYGFVLSYPDNNDYYVYEPWHWRFVGVELAEYLHDNNEFLYEQDERQLQEYRLELFD